MNVTIDEYHNVHIEGDFTGPCIDLTLSPTDAYNLFRRLEEKKSQLYDLAIYYYECRECGQHHPNTVKTCPNAELYDSWR
jgi:hypothetical protein